MFFGGATAIFFDDRYIGQLVLTLAHLDPGFWNASPPPPIPYLLHSLPFLPIPRELPIPCQEQPWPKRGAQQ